MRKNYAAKYFTILHLASGNVITVTSFLSFSVCPKGHIYAIPTHSCSSLRSHSCPSSTLIGLLLHLHLTLWPLSNKAVLLLVAIVSKHKEKLLPT